MTNEWVFLIESIVKIENMKIKKYYDSKWVFLG